MKRTALIISGLAAVFCFGFFCRTAFSKQIESQNDHNPTKDSIKTKANQLKLGAFSISLNVKDLAVSKEFYENLGFTVLAGGMDKKYLIMKNENALVGLFHGFFKGNILTFNPGWDENAKNIAKFDDVREIQRQLKSKNIKLSTEADEKTTGPASLVLTDPDGNAILIDQHR